MVVRVVRSLRSGTPVARSGLAALLPVAGTAVVLAVLPPIWFGRSTYTTGLAIITLVFASYAVGFNVIFGSTSQLFLCVGALAGIGGYATALFSDSASLPVFVGVLLGTLIAAIVGGVLSWIAVRRSLGVIFTGILTLVFSLAFQNLLLGQRQLTGGSTGHELKAAATTLADDRVGGYYLFAALVVIFLIVFRLIQTSHVGWAFRALRDDETAAELTGIDVSRYRVYAAVVGSAMIGLTGGLYAYSDGFINPTTFAFNQIDVLVLVMVVFGGLGSLLGPLLGAGVFEAVDQLLSSSGQIREFLYGLMIVALFLGFRRGLVPALGRLARRPVVPASPLQPRTDDGPAVPSAT